KQAQAYIYEYFEYYAGVRAWLDATIAQAHIDGYVETVLGRRRYIAELSSNNWQDRQYGERISANTPIQGSAADICKLAVVAIDRERMEHAYPLAVPLIVHVGVGDNWGEAKS